MNNEEIEFDQEKWYTTSQAVQLARQGYSPFRTLSVLYKIIKSGDLKVVARGDNVKKKYFIQGKEIVRYAKSQEITISNNNDGEQNKKVSSKTKRKRNLRDSSREE